MEDKKREPDYLDVATNLISALRQQDTRTTNLEKEFAAQKSLNANLEARIQRLEKEKRDLENALKRTQTENRTETKQSESLRDSFEAVFRRPCCELPDAMFWILK